MAVRVFFFFGTDPVPFPTSHFLTFRQRHFHHHHQLEIYLWHVELNACKEVRIIRVC